MEGFRENETDVMKVNASYVNTRLHLHSNTFFTEDICFISNIRPICFNKTPYDMADFLGSKQPVSFVEQCPHQIVCTVCQQSQGSRSEHKIRQCDSNIVKVNARYVYIRGYFFLYLVENIKCLQ